MRRLVFSRLRERVCCALAELLFSAGAFGRWGNVAEIFALTDFGHPEGCPEAIGWRQNLTLFGISSRLAEL
jgi:hypothetical protein